jgi:hypothetical protein
MAPVKVVLMNRRLVIIPTLFFFNPFVLNVMILSPLCIYGKKTASSELSFEIVAAIRLW